MSKLKTLLLFLLCFLFMGNTYQGAVLQAPADGIIPSLVASRTDGVAPIGIMFDATGTTAMGTSEPFRRLDYEIDYGDDTGTWVNGTGNTDKGKDFSPIGAHVYYCTNGTTCTYTATLTVRSVSVSASTTLNIAVYDPESTGNGYGDAHETACVSESADFTGCPSFVTDHITQVDEYQTAIATAVAAGAKRILFHDGQEWSRALSGTVSLVTGTRVSTFGAGVHAKISCPACNGGGLVPIFNSTNNVSIYSIDGGAASAHTSSFTGVTKTASNLAHDVLIHDVTLDTGEFNALVQQNVDSGDGTDFEAAQKGWVISETTVSTMQEPGSTNASVIFGGYNLSAFIGNHWDTGDANGGNSIRIQHGLKFLYAHNYAADFEFVITLRTKETDTGQPGFGTHGQYVVLEDNECRPATPALTIGHCFENQEGNSGAGAIYTDVLVQRNFMTDSPTGGVGTNGFLVFQVNGSFGWDIRTNILIVQDAAKWNSSEQFYRGGATTLNRFFNNTKAVWSSAAVGGTAMVRAGGAPNEAYNNLEFSVLGSPVDMGPATTADQNACGDASGGTNCEIILASSPFASASPTLPTDLQTSTAALVDHGVTVDGNFRVFDGSLITGTPDIGAWNQ